MIEVFICSILIIIFGAIAIGAIILNYERSKDA